MKVKIIADTSCDLAADPRENQLTSVVFVPFNITICEDTFLDNQKTRSELVAMMDGCEEAARTACPSPHDFMDLFEGDHDVVFVVTISSNLSGTNSSAHTARDQFLETNPDKEVYVIDSQSASAGESAVAHFLVRQLREYPEEQASIIAARTQQFAKDMTTLFVLEDLSNLMKNGRLSRVKGMIASLLNIKPLLGTNDKGEIIMVGNARGTKKAMRTLVEKIIAVAGDRDLQETEFFVSHCNAPDRAIQLKDQLEKSLNFKKIYVLETNGLSTVYASDKGIVTAF